MRCYIKKPDTALARNLMEIQDFSKQRKLCRKLNASFRKIASDFAKQVESAVDIVDSYDDEGKCICTYAMLPDGEMIDTSLTSKYSRKASMVRECGTCLSYRMEKRLINDNSEDFKLYHANFCRSRLCPMCAVRRSMKNFGQVFEICKRLVSSEQYDFIFLTLTIPNCKYGHLDETIDAMQKAFNRLIHYKKFKNAVRGFFRGLEVTYNDKKNSKSYDTFHPHFHVLLVVDKDYFTSDKYISQKEFLKLWRKAMKDDVGNIKVLDVRRVNYVSKHVMEDLERSGVDLSGMSMKQIKLAAAVAEVTKYTTKPSVFSDARVVFALSEALERRRLVAFGGIVQEIRNELFPQSRGETEETEDLVNTGLRDEAAVDPEAEYIVRRFKWDSKQKQYQMTEIMLTGAEIIEEMERRKQKLLEKYQRRRAA